MLCNFFLFSCSKMVGCPLFSMCILISFFFLQMLYCLQVPRWILILLSPKQTHKGKWTQANSIKQTKIIKRKRKKNQVENMQMHNSYSGCLFVWFGGGGCLFFWGWGWGCSFRSSYNQSNAVQFMQPKHLIAHQVLCKCTCIQNINVQNIK